MKTNDTDERALRLAKRNALIKQIFTELTIRENMSFMEAYEAVGYVFYLSADHVQKILRTHYQSQAQNFCIMAKKKQRKRKEPQVKEKSVSVPVCLSCIVPPINPP